MPTFAMRKIVKRFPGVVANNDVDLTIEAGEIHALLGENGAGKSTLMQILYGFHSMDSGSILIDGEPVEITSPKDAIALGIGMVHQEFMLVRRFSVVENTVLGLKEDAGPMLDLRKAARRLRRLSDQHHLAVDPDAQVQHLPIGVQQRVEILKLLYRDAKLLILDEPTAVLTTHEKDQLFAVLRGLRDQGRSIVIVTHKLQEILELADRVTVMRDGRVVGSVTTQQTTEQELARLMVGRDVNLRANRVPIERGRAVLRVNGLHVLRRRGPGEGPRRKPRCPCGRNRRHRRCRRQRAVAIGRSDHAFAAATSRTNLPRGTRGHPADGRAASRSRPVLYSRRSPACRRGHGDVALPTTQSSGRNGSAPEDCFSTGAKSASMQRDWSRASECVPPVSAPWRASFPAAICRS